MKAVRPGKEFPDLFFYLFDFLGAAGEGAVLRGD